MTDLTRERLAELRVIADKASMGPWAYNNGWINAPLGSICELTRLGWAPDAKHITAFDPPTVLTLIAQCEAGLPASGGVSGEHGELARVLESLSYGSDTTSRDAHSIIVALLAERDGLKRQVEIAHSGAIGLAERNITSNAALADALGLLREFGSWDNGGWAEADIARYRKWQARRDAFLANHPEPSP